MEELIQKAQKGDIQAYNAIVKLIEKDLYKIACIKLKSDDDIFDAIQNTLLNVYKNIRRLRNVQYFKSWVIKILTNECNAIYRINMRNNKIIEKVSNSYIQNIKETCDISIVEEFDDIIYKLNPDEQLIFILYYRDKYSCDEISKIIKRNKNTIKSKLNRGRKK